MFYQRILEKVVDKAAEKLSNRISDELLKNSISQFMSDFFEDEENYDTIVEAMALVVLDELEFDESGMADIVEFEVDNDVVENEDVVENDDISSSSNPLLLV